MQLYCKGWGSHLKGYSFTKYKHNANQDNVKEATSQGFKFGILELKFYQNNLTEIQIEDSQLKLWLFMRIICTGPFGDALVRAFLYKDFESILCIWYFLS